MRSVAFVASNDTHVDLFAPIVETLDRRGCSSQLGSLDSLYHQGANARGAMRGLSVTDIVQRPRASRVPFYARSLTAVWRDVLASREPIQQWLRRVDPSVVVLGNDRGLVEKVVLNAAHRQDRRVVLVQDGVLGPRPTRSSPGAQVRLFVKRGGSRILRGVGLAYLGASQYGAGGADLVCATGKHGADHFRRVGVPSNRVHITGQPRFDGLGAVDRSQSRSRVVTMFTTPFAHAGHGVDLQQRQVDLAAELARALPEIGASFRVKPHPREDVGAYLKVLPGSATVQGGSSVEALSEAGVAVIGISTVLEEAGLLRVPVVVPGDVVHAGRMSELLPPADVYPRFEDGSSAVRLIRALIDDPASRAALEAAQADAVASRVHVDPSSSAASLIADAITSLMR